MTYLGWVLFGVGAVGCGQSAASGGEYGSSSLQLLDASACAAAGRVTMDAGTNGTAQRDSSASSAPSADVQSGGEDAGEGEQASTLPPRCGAEQVQCGALSYTNAEGEHVVENCEDELANNDQVQKRCADYEECVDNRCECTPAAQHAEGAQISCGQVNNCTAEGLDLGDCADQIGENWFCADDHVCRCTPKTRGQACGDNRCGDADDGCGGRVSCNDTPDGVCGPAEVCEEQGGVRTCHCAAFVDASTLEFCADKCGQHTLPTTLGCTVDCGDRCPLCESEQACGGFAAACQCDVSEVCGRDAVCCREAPQAQLCADKGCGETVTDPCTGAVRVCGCAQGEACLLARFRAEPVADSARFEGASSNVCVDAEVARVAGQYLVRTHSFAEDDGAGTLNSVTRSEALSLVTVAYDTGHERFWLRDVGCVASNRAYNGNTSLAVGYWRLDPVIRPLEVDIDAGTWNRPFRSPAGDAAHGVPTGWANVSCEEQSKPWLSGACSCRDVDDSCAGGSVRAACMPVQSGQRSSDCRVDDVDGDELPGFSLYFEGGLAHGTTLQVATVADIRWSGTLSNEGAHTGVAEEPSPILRSIVGCSKTGVLNPCGRVTAVEGASCGAQFNRIQWVKLSEDEFDLACGDFYRGLDLKRELARSIADVAQNVIDDRFKNVGPPCANGLGCPEGMLCKEQQCWPMTTDGACSNDRECGAGWQCLERACWPRFTSWSALEAKCGAFN